jgi:transcriptional regulator with XRE-family HTH domain
MISTYTNVSILATFARPTVAQVDIWAQRSHHCRVDWFYRGFGTKVRQARGGGLTQEELAARVKLSRTSIANIEAGRQRVPLHMLHVFAQALGVAPESLLPAHEQPEPAVRPELVADLVPEERRLVEQVVGRARAGDTEAVHEKP